MNHKEAKRLTDMAIVTVFPVLDRNINLLDLEADLYKAMKTVPRDLYDKQLVLSQMIPIMLAKSDITLDSAQRMELNLIISKVLAQ